MNKFYQACYGKPGSNWELYNLSSDIPPNMAAFFERAGSSCTPQNLGAENLVDTKGKPLCLYEILSDEHILCVLRAQYGERDNFGRPKMYAHGFMFAAEGILDNPDSVLSISDDNFKFDAVSSKNIPTVLKLDSGFDIDESLNHLNMNKDRWIGLMKCVYLLLASPTDFPLYVICDTEQKTIKNLIFCILTALPYSLRYNLSFANANSFQYAKFKRIMFVNTLSNDEAYFDLFSGDTNMDLSDIESYPEKFGALKYFSDHTMPMFSSYCAELQEICSKIGMTYNASFDDVNLAEIFKKGTKHLDAIDDKSLTKYLLELLVKAPAQNLYVDDFIAVALEKYNVRELIPNETIMNRIELRAERTQSKVFSDVSKKIRMRLLLNNGVHEMISFLIQQYEKSKESFFDWCSIINSVPGGKNAIISFYKSVINLKNNYDDIIQLKKEAKDYWNSSVIQDAIMVKCTDICCKNITAANLNKRNFEDDFRKYGKTIKDLSGKVPDREYYTVLENFWKSFVIDDFKFENTVISNCRVCMKGVENRFTVNISLLLGLYDSVNKFNAQKVGYRSVKQAVDAIEDHTLTNSELKIIAPKVQDFMLESLQNAKDKYFCMWLKIVELGAVDNKNPLDEMVNWGLPVIRDAECFQLELERDKEMRDIANNIFYWMCERDRNRGILYRINSKTHPELYENIIHEAKIIENYLRQLPHTQRIKMNDYNIDKNKDVRIARQNMGYENNSPDTELKYQHVKKSNGIAISRQKEEAEDLDSNSLRYDNVTHVSSKGKHNKNSSIMNTIGGLFSKKNKK